MKVLKPPYPLPGKLTMKSVFLSGSIEQGMAADWQQRVTAGLEDLDIIILNPRRDSWDSSWEQKKENPLFREQVEWELDALELADLIAIYFDPATKAPITLLELGLHARTGKVLICCPDGFWRRGNVEIVAYRFHIPFFENLDELIVGIRKRVGTGPKYDVGLREE